MRDITDLIYLLVYSLIACTMEIFKAFIPNGVLPRKNVAGKNDAFVSTK